MRFSGPKKNNHGGPRPNTGGRRAGAGRKAGAVTVRTRDMAEKIIAEGKILPLDVLLEIMHFHLEAGRLQEAHAVAVDAAPYVHAKLGAVQHKGAFEQPAPAFRLEIISPTGEIIDLDGDIDG